MKKLLALLVFPLLILSCGTPRERAERLVKKANKIFPIDSLVSEKIRIDTLIKYDTTVVVKDTTIKVEVPVYVNNPDGTKTFTSYDNKVIMDNTKVKVTATTDGKGNLKLNVLLKEHSIKVVGYVKYQKQIITNRRIITVTNNVKGFFWWFGLSMTIAIGGTLIFLSIRRIKQFLP